MNELKEGTELETVVGSIPNEDGDVAVWTVNPAYPTMMTCTRITVTEQSGHLAAVPWARCEHESGEIELVNLATVESVTLVGGQS